MPHILKDHEQRAALSTDAKEAHNVLVLQHGQQLGLALEVLPRTLGHLFQRLESGVGTVLRGALISLHPGQPL